MRNLLVHVSHFKKCAPRSTGLSIDRTSPCTYCESARIIKGETYKYPHANTHPKRDSFRWRRGEIKVAFPSLDIKNGNRLLPRRHHHHHPYLQHLDPQPTPTPTQLFDSLQSKSFVCMQAAAKATARRRRRELPDRHENLQTDTPPPPLIILHRLRDRRTTNKQTAIKPDPDLSSIILYFPTATTL